MALFNHLLAQIDAQGAVDQDFLKNVDGFDAALSTAKDASLDPTGLDADLVRDFCDMWIGNPKVVTIYSQGVNQSSSGADKVNAILNCHLATGRIGLPGCGPFSVTGQPNAMGGREVGGLANMLANHLDIENEAHRDLVQSHWNAPTIPTTQGLKAVDMFEAIHAGKIKALWVIHTNPAVTLPDAGRVAEAIQNCDFTVVSDITATSDTARLADVILPASAWGEKSGTVTNSDRTISRQRSLMPAPGQARADWKILCDVATRMGWAEAFDYETEADIFREYTALSTAARVFGKDLDLSGWDGMSNADYDALRPTRWPVSDTRQGGRFFADGQFFHAGGKAKMLAVTHRAPATKRAPKYPFRLNTGRIRDQWHTMTRTGLSPRLSSHLAEPFVDIHPQDAEALGITAADLVQLTSPQGQSILRARITTDVRPGDVFAPIHWTGETAPSARIDQLVAPFVDPVSGQPESKASVVALAPYKAAWYGFAICAERSGPGLRILGPCADAAGLAGRACRPERPRGLGGRSPQDLQPAGGHRPSDARPGQGHRADRLPRRRPPAGGAVCRARARGRDARLPCAPARQRGRRRADRPCAAGSAGSRPRAVFLFLGRDQYDLGRH